MYKGDFIFTSESVANGHPDKVADSVSDAILDAMLAQDPNSRVAVETMVTTGLCIVAGEVTTKGYVEIPDVVRKTICEIGYDRDGLAFNGHNCAVIVTLDAQSGDISMGVSEDEGHEQGAGDQGMMFGFACKDTDVLMPMPIHLSHRMMESIRDARVKNEISWLRPDAKGQFTIEYKAGKPVAIKTVVLSTQHDESVCADGGKGKFLDEARRELIEKVIKPIIPPHLLTDKIEYLINPTGRFVIGGPHGDSGLTGRKIIVDTYGGMGHHGGGCFSGKDPSKVDRSSAYMGRYIAKNLVAAGLADFCEVQLAYAIGVAEPVSVNVNTFDTGKLAQDAIVSIIREHFPLKPKDIIKHLDLKRPIFRKTSAFGHFGREDADFTWEKTDKAQDIAKSAGL